LSSPIVLPAPLPAVPITTPLPPVTPVAVEPIVDPNAERTIAVDMPDNVTADAKDAATEKDTSLSCATMPSQPGDLLIALLVASFCVLGRRAVRREI
jgi:hypothetical protein